MKKTFFLLLGIALAYGNPLMPAIPGQALARLSLLVADPSGVKLMKFDPRAGKFLVANRESSKACYHMSADSRFIYAASIDTLYQWDHSLKQRKEKLLGKIGSLADFKGNPLISVDGFLLALDESFNTLCCLAMVTDSEGRPKNVHDILIFEKTAYLLDNIAEPIYVLKVDLTSLKKLKKIEELVIYCSPANSAPHLVGQWLDVETDRWAIIASVSSYTNMGGSGDPSQQLLILSAFGKNKSEDEDYPEGIMFSGASEKSVPISDEGIWIIRNTSLSPAWVVYQKPNYGLIESKHSSLYVGIGKVVEKPKSKENYSWKEFDLSVEKVLSLDIKNFNENSRVSLKKYKDWLFIGIDNVLKVIDVSNRPKEILSQVLEKPVNDLFIIEK